MRLPGEALFRGIAFGEGSVGQQLPEIWAHLPRFRPDQEAALISGKRTLIAEMQTADATFFERFATEIQSGDRLRVERTLDESARLVRRVAKRPSVADDPINTCVAVATVAVALGNFAVAFNVAVYANWAYAINWFYGTDGEGTDVGTDDGGGGTDGGGTIDGEGLWSGNPLRHDQVVDMIATRLVAVDERPSHDRP